MRIWAKGSLTACAVLALMASAVSAMEMKDSGSFDAAYVKRDVHPIDQDHVLILSNSKGTSKNPNGYLDGFATTISDLVDLTQGNGSQQGYVVYSNGADQEIVKISGTVTTKMKDGHPDTSFQGTWVIVKATGRTQWRTRRGHLFRLLRRGGQVPRGLARPNREAQDDRKREVSRSRLPTVRTRPQSCPISHCASIFW